MKRAGCLDSVGTARDFTIEQTINMEEKYRWNR